MADGTDNQVSDGSSADRPVESQGHPLTHPVNADPGRVARIVAALRKAHADTAETTDAPAPRRETTGVRPVKPPVPTLRWNPGARYRASRLAERPAPQASPAPPSAAAAPAGPRVHAPVPAPPTAPPAAAPALPPVPAPPALAGRLYRGPARRTGVFEREIWYPVARSSRVPRDVGEALIAAVERYRKGSISTSGLVRAIGNAHAA